MEKTSTNIKRFTITSMFVAIIMLMAFTPFGYVNLGFIKATIVHVPVIIGSILLGPKMGAVLGATFGLSSIISNTMTPAVLSFVFSPMIPVPGTGKGSPLALIICFVPRILVGVVPYYVYHLLKKVTKKKKGAEIPILAISGVAGAMTNTLLVMHLIFFLFKDAYASARDISVEAVYGAILSIIAINGIPEAIVAGIITAAVVRVCVRFTEGA